MWPSSGVARVKPNICVYVCRCINTCICMCVCIYVYIYLSVNCKDPKRCSGIDLVAVLHHSRSLDLGLKITCSRLTQLEHGPPELYPSWEAGSPFPARRLPFLVPLAFWAPCLSKTKPIAILQPLRPLLCVLKLQEWEAKHSMRAFVNARTCRRGTPASG